MSSQPQLGLFDTLVMQKPALRWEKRDVCANRHGGNQESAEAHERVAPGKQQMHARIYAWALAQPAGITCDEASVAFQCSPNAISGRLSEMKALGLLRATSERRKTRSGCGARVLRAVLGTPSGGQHRD